MAKKKSAEEKVVYATQEALVAISDDGGTTTAVISKSEHTGGSKRVSEETRRWLENQNPPEKKLTKKQREKAEKAKLNPKKRSAYARTSQWLEDALEMNSTAIEMSEGADQRIIDGLLKRREALMNGLPEEIKAPEYDEYYYTIDVMDGFRITHDVNEYAELEREIRWQSHLMPYLRGQTIGGASKEICFTIIRVYKAWARKTIETYGPKYLEIQS